MEILFDLKTENGKVEALEALQKRKKRASEKRKIDNTSLHAGSPMFYYCRLCNLLADTLPETHSRSPKEYCYECQPLIDAGWSDEEQQFIEYTNVTCSECGGSGKTSYNDYYTKRPRNCSNCGGEGSFKKRK